MKQQQPSSCEFLISVPDQFEALACNTRMILLSQLGLFALLIQERSTLILNGIISTYRINAGQVLQETRIYLNGSNNCFLIMPKLIINYLHFAQGSSPSTGDALEGFDDLSLLLSVWFLSLE